MAVFLLHDDVAAPATDLDKAVLGTTLPLAQRGLRLGQPQQRVPPVAIFAAALLLSAVGLIPVQIAFVAAVVILIMGKFVSLREAYASVD